MSSPTPAQEVGSELDFDERIVFQPVRCSLEQIVSSEPGVVTLMHSGRAAIRGALRGIAAASAAPLRFLVPSYLCPAVLQPFQELGVGYDFYPLGDQLCADWDRALELASSGRYNGLLFIRYFGAAQHDRPPRELFAQGPNFFVIEDRVQAMLSAAVGERGDYVIYSFRKFFGLPDGGAVWARKDCPPVPEPDGGEAFWGLRLLAFRLRELYRSEGWGTRADYLSAFREAEESLNTSRNDAAMSPFSRKVLERQDVEFARRRRRENFAYLRENWPDQQEVVPLALQWGLTDVPLGFPILARNRDVFQKALIGRGIFPPVHWHLPQELRGDLRYSPARELSQRILTIPCDQRYGRKDMARVTTTVREILSAAAS